MSSSPPKDMSKVSVKFNFRARMGIVSRANGELERYGAFDVRARMLVTNHDSCTWTAAVAEPGHVFNVTGAFTVMTPEDDERVAYLRNRHVTDIVKFHIWVPAPPTANKFADSPLTHAAESMMGLQEAPVAPLRHTRELMFVSAGFASLRDVLATACGAREGKMPLEIIRPPSGFTLAMEHNFQATGVLLHVEAFDKASPQFAEAQRNFQEYLKLSNSGLIARCPLNDSDKFNQDLIKIAQTLSQNITDTMHLNHDDGDDVLAGQITMIPMQGQATLFTGINRSIRMARHRSEPDQLVMLHVVHAMNIMDVACGITLHRNLDANTISMLSDSSNKKDEFKHIKDSVFTARGNEEKYDKRGLPWIPMQDHFTATVLTVFTVCPRASPYVSDRTFAGARQADERETLIITSKAAARRAAAGGSTNASLQTNRNKSNRNRNKKAQGSMSTPTAPKTVIADPSLSSPATSTPSVFDSSSLYNLSVDLETLADTDSFMIPIAAGTEHIEAGQCHPHQFADGFMHLGDCEDKARKIQQIKMGIINLGEKIEAFAGPNSGNTSTNGKLSGPFSGTTQRLMSGLRLDRLQEFARKHVLNSPLLDLTMAQAVNVLQSVHMMAFRFKNGEYNVHGVFGTANGASADKTTTQIGGHAWAMLESSYIKQKTSALLLEGTAFVSQQSSRIFKTLHGVIKMEHIPFDKRQFLLAHGWREMLGTGLSSPTEPMDASNPLFKEINAEQFEQFMMTMEAFKPFLKTPTITEDPSGMSAAANPRMRQCIPYFPLSITHEIPQKALTGSSAEGVNGEPVPAKSFYGKAFVKGEKLITTEDVNSDANSMVERSFGVWYDDIAEAKTRTIEVVGNPFPPDHMQKLLTWADERDESGVHGPPVKVNEMVGLLAQAFGRAKLTTSGSTVPVEETLNIVVSEAADNMEQRQYMRNMSSGICERENATYKSAGKQHVFKTFEAYNSVVRVLIAKVADLQSNISVEASDLQL